MAIRYRGGGAGHVDPAQRANREEYKVESDSECTGEDLSQGALLLEEMANTTKGGVYCSLSAEEVESDVSDESISEDGEVDNGKDIDKGEDIEGSEIENSSWGSGADESEELIDEYLDDENGF